MKNLLTIVALCLSFTSIGQTRELVNEHTRSKIFYNGEDFLIHFLDNGNKKATILSFSADELETFEYLMNRSYSEKENINFLQDGKPCALIAKHNGCLMKWSGGETLIFRIELDKFVNYEKVTYLKRKINEEKKT